MTARSIATEFVLAAPTTQMRHGHFDSDVVERAAEVLLESMDDLPPDDVTTWTSEVLFRALDASMETNLYGLRATLIELGGQLVAWISKIDAQLEKEAA